MARHKDAVWILDDQPSLQGAQLAVLMDIRDELKALNRVMACPNVQAGFIALRSIGKTTRTIDRRLSKKIKLK